MKKSLLDIVQSILNDMDSDLVNSIDDTEEAYQVAAIVRSCYNEMISNRNWPHLKKLIQLEHSGDLSKPTHLQVPENLKELTLFNYDNHKLDSNKVEFREIKYKYPDEFLRFISTRNSNHPNTETITDTSGVRLLILNNYAPSYWTSFDDRYIVCDSYDKSVDDTLKKSKTQAYAVMDPVWVHKDDAIPDLPSEAFAALEEEAKSTAFLYLKQTANQKAEQKSTRQQRWLARKAWRAKGGVRYDNYGRKSRV